MPTHWSPRQRSNRVNLIGLCVGAIIVFFLFRDALLPSSSTGSSSASGSAASRAKALATSQRQSDNDVEMVVASMKHENVSWLDEYLPEWKKNIYVVDDNKAKLTVPMNKGREAMVFLRYVAIPVCGQA